MEEKTWILLKIILIKMHIIDKKNLITINNGEINKMVLSKKDSYRNKDAFKYFIRYISNTGIIPLYIILPQMNAYTKYFDNGNKYMSLLVYDKKLLGRYNEIWEKLKTYLKKIDNEPVYNDKFIKSKIHERLWQ